MGDPPDVRDLGGPRRAARGVADPDPGISPMVASARGTGPDALGVLLRCDGGWALCLGDTDLAGVVDLRIWDARGVGCRGDPTPCVPRIRPVGTGNLGVRGPGAGFLCPRADLGFAAGVAGHGGRT